MLALDSMILSSLFHKKQKKISLYLSPLTTKEKEIKEKRSKKISLILTSLSTTISLSTHETPTSLILPSLHSVTKTQQTFTRIPLHSL